MNLLNIIGFIDVVHGTLVGLSSYSSLKIISVQNHPWDFIIPKEK